MPIRVICKVCKATIKAPDQLAGKKVKCPKCANALVVPAQEEDEEFAPVEIMPDERIRETPSKKSKSRSRHEDEDDEEEDDRDDHRHRVRAERDDDRRRRDRDDEDRRSRVREEDEDDRRRSRKRSRDEDEDEEDNRGPRFKPCPQCKARGAKRVLWTAWGSFYGPAMFSHVRCPECGYCYNGKTGRSNLLAAIIFVSVPLIGIIGIIGGIFYLLYSRGYFGR
jgi:hypothetical protein